MSKIDLKFLGFKYCNPRSMNPNSVNVNTFLDDFNKVRK